MRSRHCAVVCLIGTSCMQKPKTWRVRLTSLMLLKNYQMHPYQTEDGSRLPNRENRLELLSITNVNSCIIPTRIKTLINVNLPRTMISYVILAFSLLWSSICYYFHGIELKIVLCTIRY